MGHTTSYQGQSKFKPNYKMPPVYLGVIEQRPYIIDESKSPTYTGTLRSIGGVPYNINTKSGLPVTVVLQGLVKRTLAAQGVAVYDLMVFPAGITEKNAVKKLTPSDKKSLLLFLREWRSHIYFNPIFIYDLKLLVVGNHGAVLASCIKKGEVEFGNDKPVKTLAEAISNIFEDLFNDEEITTALLSLKDDTTGQQKVTKPAKLIVKDTKKKKLKCSTDQILKMKAMGMADGQMKAMGMADGQMKAMGMADGQMKAMGMADGQIKAACE
jgi:hypothetical protein